MHPFLIVCLALLIPLVLVVILFVPAYLGIFMSVYLIYDSVGKGDEAWDNLYQFVRVIDSYREQVSYWKTYSGQLDFWHYTLPLLGPAITGMILSVLFFYFFTRYAVNIFRLTS